MDNDLRPGNNRTLILGLGTLVLFAAFALSVRFFMNVDGIGRPDSALGEDPAASFDRLTGTPGDTARVVRLGTLSPELDESSGVAVSRRHPEVVWSHNDGGDGRLYSVRPDGTILARIAVQAGDAVDWEDLDLGPCPGRATYDATGTTDCLYIADVGDNQAERSTMTIVIVPEPDPTAPGSVPALGSITFRYPDGPADTEALALAPGGDLLLITKGTDGSGRLYRLTPDLQSGGVQDAVLMGPLPTATTEEGDWITGAAISPDGRTLAVRNHHAVYLSPLADPLSAPTLCEIGMHQPQGEGVDFLDDSRLILTSEEEGGRAPVVRLRCP